MLLIWYKRQLLLSSFSQFTILGPASTMGFLIHGPPRWKEDQIYAPGLFLTPKIWLFTFRRLTCHSYLVSKKVMFITRKISSLAGFSLGTPSGPLLWSPHSLLWRWCSTGHHFYFLLLFLCYCLLVCCRFVFHSPPVVVTGLYRWSFLLNSCLYVIACFCIVLSFIRLLLWRRCSPGDPFDLTLAFMLLFVLFFIRLLIWWWCSAGDLD